MDLRAFRIAYDGSDYYGFQRQPDVPTVEDALFDALRDLGVLDPDARKPVGYAAAGRTDAGVSALAQTVALEAPDWLTPRAFNGELPADVRAWAAADASDGFHATHHATRREYTYHLYAPPANRREGNEPARAAVDGDRFRAACDALSGTHDFHNLTPDDRNTERSPTLEASRDGDYLVVDVSAGGFARELVRRLVSLARSVGTGERSFGDLERALEPEPLPGHEGIAPAPPEPLVLSAVDYPDLAFEVDEDAAASARAVFDRRRIERRTGSRVVGQLRDGLR
ncbi:tRNA pseudouridine(38-40) synthase TruA [Natronococcus sp. A-GB7]|uniref:tRNA pseudouridine(38-40) synthase TruA n=1 Tax=Natronococcus sp. A-GB7 TaxID=3037649 RepID=UPI00241FB6FB|nr:tRNA pseudouridine(38-40) synthase TruA [Natronococcus sp. A-GB7]MDG5820849.1 tRNA pseudouridine(38-40) synthase TruA [Natronococcus sp. A-GB7]